MGPALARMLEEEPTVRLERTATGEQVLRTMGEAHTAVIIERLKRKFGAAIATHTPKVPYKETIRGTTKVARPVQEADRRPRHVRRRLARARAQPGRRRRVRREGRRWVGAEGLLPGRREGHPRGGRGRRAGRLSRCPTSRPPSTTARSTRSTRTSCRSRSPPRWRSRTASSRPSPRCSSRSWPSRSASPSSTWARSTATSTAVAAGCSAWTPTAACRSSRPTSPRPSCSPTPPSCARWPTAAARSRRRSTTTRTCRRTSPTRSSPSIARPWRPEHGGH